MGREIRCVPPEWKHPIDENGSYKPLFRFDFDVDLNYWLAAYNLWKDGNHPEQKKIHNIHDFVDYEGSPPDPLDYALYRKEDCSWFQVYETISEGTPVTPPFETKEQLIDYLVKYGDFWDQHQGLNGWEREVAEKFVKIGFAMTGAIIDGKFKRPRDGQF